MGGATNRMPDALDPTNRTCPEHKRAKRPQANCTYGHVNEAANLYSDNYLASIGCDVPLRVCEKDCK